jgi:hypothetical protein
MKPKKILFYLLAVLMGGCIPVMSLNPLYEKKDLLFEEKLLGTWVDANDPNLAEGAWEFRRSTESEKAYELTITAKEKNKGPFAIGSFAAHLVKLDGSLFMDVFPNRLSSGKEQVDQESLVYNAFFFIPAHTFLKIDFITPLARIKDHIPDANMNNIRRLMSDYDYELRLRITDDDECEKLLKEDPNAVKYEKVKDHGIVLTMSTKELQKFVVKYAGDERLFVKPQDLIRARSKEPPKPTGRDSNSPPKK